MIAPKGIASFLLKLVLSSSVSAAQQERPLAMGAAKTIAQEASTTSLSQLRAASVSLVERTVMCAEIRILQMAWLEAPAAPVQETLFLRPSTPPTVKNRAQAMSTEFHQP